MAEEKWKERLEAMIDSHGLGSVLTAIAVICEEKAEHLESNWQDDVLAKAWRKDAKKVTRTADSVQG